MISLSQAYVLRKIWGRKTNNKSYLKYLLNSWTFNLFLKNNLIFFLQEQGIISYWELSHFKQKNWQEWINLFNRYNLSPKLWYGIAPQKWRFEVSEHWKKKKFSIEKIKNFTISEQRKNSPIFCVNSSMKSTKKSNKLFENTVLNFKFLDSNRNSIIHRFSKLNENSIYSDIIIDKKHKYPFVSERKIFFEHNLLLWFIPEFVKRKKKYKKIVNSDNSIIKYKKLQIFHKKELFKERELNPPIRQWRWKYRNYEKKFKKLGNMASLMTFMQNQETMISLSEKMRKDLNLFRLFFRRNNHFNGLATNSEHRLPRLLNDQILIYKLIGTSLNFKQRLKKILDLQNIDECSSKNIILKDKKTKIRSINSFFNLEDILLPKRRREFRILNSLVLQQEKNIETLERANPLKDIRELDNKIAINTNKIIKRFIWPSYRFEDLACMNRFWLGTMNGSRFSLLRLRMYPLI